MTEVNIKTSFAAGEISPSCFGRTDLAKYGIGASTMRNFFVSYRGGAYSRAGTALVGKCKQSATGAPPRDIPFQFSIRQGYALEFGDQYMRVISDGAYVTEVTNPITGVTQANPGVFSYTNTNYTLANDDWVFIENIGGMTNFNGMTWIVKNATSTTFTLNDLFGNPVDTSSFAPYSSGGTLARIYTKVAPYAAVDLPYLKFTQSADTMTLCCVNQQTGTEYPSYELQRVAATNWTFTADTFGTSIGAPTGITVTAHSSTAVSTWYSYVVTAIDAVTGEESIASVVGSVENNDIAVNAGSNSITWNHVPGTSTYNVYKATPSYSVEVPIGAQFGFAGSAFGPAFTDTNITADFTRVPPVHDDPFARGAITAATPTAGGTGYTQATIGYTITTGTGSGFVGTPVVVGDALAAFIIENGGKGYINADTITITDSGVGAGATATLSVGPQTGTYPSTVAYFQQRRVYASTKNQPDTYFMSQPGAFQNFDSGTPVVDSDAIIGTPWAEQVNGIQFLVPMPGGLVAFTGQRPWLLNGGTNAAITPSDQVATPQATNGCSAIVPPLTINYDILYVQEKGSVVRDLSFNLLQNIYTGTDMTVISDQLFYNHSILQWAWAEEPYKIIWAIREDGIMLSQTYLKEQEVFGWARHDTNGLFVGVCSITEPHSSDLNTAGGRGPLTDAVYLKVKRYVNGQWVYYSERMDDRNWFVVEDCWCVDAGLSYPQTFPQATLTPDAADGTDNISAVLVIQGGSDYTNPTVRAIDPFGTGSGAIFSVTLVSGVITAITPDDEGQAYADGTTLQISDATGTGAIAQPIITNNVTFTASSGVFSADNVGDVIRSGGGIATVTSYVSSTEVVANITQAITKTIPNNPDEMPIPQLAGEWTISTPTTVVNGLNHLEGMDVAILADGSIVNNQTVVNGSITLQQAASSIVVGLPYLPQLQSMYLDPQGQMTSQGKRKNIYAVTVRVQASRGMRIGVNQPDASTQPNQATVPWTNMEQFKSRSALLNAGASIPLFSGDERPIVKGTWDEKAQIALEQPFALPANVLAFIPEFSIGDNG